MNIDVEPLAAAGTDFMKKTLHLPFGLHVTLWDVRRNVRIDFNRTSRLDGIDEPFGFRRHRIEPFFGQVQLKVVTLKQSRQSNDNNKQTDGADSIINRASPGVCAVSPMASGNENHADVQRRDSAADEKYR